eukprot:TRINITY_DN10693_c0_g1_i4.p1 TRINITY_DN10693_c0_g1~~TRINITY_DN10693_c0_g1_i4.p1  ORF type:complete len:1305 (+),score=424.31 TRINITY_DN10693_c0_g1_i4:3-3917(+)
MYHKVSWLVSHGFLVKQTRRLNNVSMNFLKLACFEQETTPEHELCELINKSIEVLQKEHDNIIPDTELARRVGVIGKLKKTVWERLKHRLVQSGKVQKVTVNVDKPTKQRDFDGQVVMDTRQIRCLRLVTRPVEEQEAAVSTLATLDLESQVVKFVEESGAAGLCSTEVYSHFGAVTKNDKKRFYKIIHKLSQAKQLVPILENVVGTKNQAYRLISHKHFTEQRHYSEADLKLLQKQGSTKMITAEAAPPEAEGAEEESAPPTKRQKSTRRSLKRQSAQALGLDTETVYSTTFLQRRQYILDKLAVEQLLFKQTLASMLTELTRSEVSTGSVVDKRTVQKIVSHLVSEKLVQEMQCELSTGRKVDLIALPELSFEQVMASKPLQELKKGKTWHLGLGARVKLDENASSRVQQQLRETPPNKRKAAAAKERKPAAPGRVIAYLYGFFSGTMERAKAFHEFLWAAYEEQTDEGEHLQMDAVIEKMPLKLFLQVVGLFKSVPEVHDCLRRGDAVGQVPADVRRQLTSATGRQNVKRMLSILHSLELVEPAQRDEDSVAFTFKHLKIKKNIQLQLPDWIPTFDFPTKFKFNGIEHVEQFWSTFEFLATRQQDLRHSLHNPAELAQLKVERKKLWFNPVEWGVRDKNLDSHMRVLEQKRAAGLPRTPQEWDSFSKEIRLAVVQTVQYFRQHPHPRVVPPHLLAKPQKPQSTPKPARPKQPPAKTPAETEETGALEDLELEAGQAPARKVQLRERWHADQDEALINAWVEQQVEAAQAATNKKISFKIVADSVNGKNRIQAQKRIMILRRRDATRYSMDDMIIKQLRAKGVQPPASMLGEQVATQPALRLTVEDTLANYNMHLAAMSRGVPNPARPGDVRAKQAGCPIPWDTLTHMETMAVDFILQVNAMPEELYNAEVAAAVHAVASSFGHQVLGAASDLLKEGGFLRKKKSTIASRGLFQRAFTASATFRDLVSNSQISRSVYEKAREFMHVLPTQRELQPEFNSGGHLAVCLSQMCTGKGTLTVDLTPEDPMERSAKAKRTGVREHLLRTEGKDTLQLVLPLQEPVFESFRVWEVPEEPEAKEEAEEADVKPEDDPEERFKDIAEAIGMPAEKRVEMQEVLCKIREAALEGVVLHDTEVACASELEALGLASQSHCAERWHCSAQQNVSTMRLPWGGQHGLLHLEYIRDLRARIVALIFKRPSLSFEELQKLVPVVSPQTLKTVLNLLESDGALVMQSFVRTRPSLFGSGELRPVSKGSPEANTTLLFLTPDCISSALGTEGAGPKAPVLPITAAPANVPGAINADP